MNEIETAKENIRSIEKEIEEPMIPENLMKKVHEVSDCFRQK